MAMTNEELAAAKDIATDIATIALTLFDQLRDVNNSYGRRFNETQAFELTKILITYAVNGVDEA